MLNSHRARSSPIFLLIFICILCSAWFSSTPVTAATISCSSGQYYEDCTNKCTTCPAGHYCPAGANQPTPCPKGTARSSTGGSSLGSCTACASNYYTITTGSTACVICPAGFECTSASTRPQPCASGHYSLEGDTSCTQCPTGHYCPQADADPIECPKGTYSASQGATECTPCSSPTEYTTSTGRTSCSACPSDKTCRNPEESPQDCPSGTYIDGGSPNVCLPCPAGKECPTVTGTPSNCGAGTYSPGGAITSCLACPAGHYSTGSSNTECTSCPSGHDCTDPTTASTCAAGTYSPSIYDPCVSCPSGTYQELTGQTGCKNCPPGYKCPDANKDSAPIQCSTGEYSDPNDPTTCVSCPAGTWSDPADSYTACAPCPAGSSCSGDGTASACSAGSWSPQGSSSCITCPAGYSCADPSVLPVRCPTGQYSNAGASGCTSCPAGQACLDSSKGPEACASNEYSAAGSSLCLPCPAGKSCSSPSATPADCASGYYSLSGSTSCTQCPAGSFCPVTTNGPVKCPPGFYSAAGATECTECPAGSKCTSTTGAPVSCPSGTFSVPGSTDCEACLPGFFCASTASLLQEPCAQGTYSAGSTTSCTDCPAGKACPSPLGEGIIDCQPGYYSTGKQISCFKCPSGKECSDPTIAPQDCPAGTFSMGGATSCTSCPAGFFCPTPDVLPQLCPAGTYSAGGADVCTTCDAGYICPGGSSVAAPTDGECKKGTYCIAGAVAPTPCPAGKIGSKDAGESEADACVDCPAGYYCEPGTYETSERIECPPGYYCPTGTGTALENPCAAGTYNPSRGSTSSGDCLTCPEKYFCIAGSSTYETQPCYPGYYCPTGTGSKTQNACPAGTFNREKLQSSSAACLECPAGTECPAGSSNPSPCPRGQYKASSGAGSCTNCPAGYSCPFYGMSDPNAFRCLPGYYCPAGSVREYQNQCPPGTFSDRPDLTASTECEICPRGFYCPSGTGGRQQPQPCAQGHYCPGAPTRGESDTIYYNDGSYPSLRGTTYATEFPCPPGTYSSRNDLISSDQCDKCPAGYWCAGGTNRWSGYCEAGYYCPEGTYSPTQFPCPAGTYSSATNLTSENECLPCPEGHYCGEAFTEPVQCPVGTFANFTRATRMGPSNDWDSGYCMECPAGHYCEAGTIQPTECGVSNYSPPGQGCCNSCEIGHYCPLNTTSLIQMNETFLCPAGMYCERGQGPTPTLFANACPVGHFCVEATQAPEPCSAGKYGPNTGRKSDDECTICPAGDYCTGGNSEIDGECAKGFYCPEGSSRSDQVACPERTYRDSVGAQNEQHCAICPNGFYCENATVTPILCPAGYYCIIGSSEPESCPIGTFSNTSGLKEPEDCTPCPAGYYCDGVGAIEPSGLCDPGFYCVGSAFTSAPPDEPTGGLCPRGGYCEMGSSYPSTCEAGTYNNYTGGRTQEDCYACPAGSYCAGSNLPLPSGPCSAGWYCTGGAFLPTQHEVPAGYYSLDGASEPTPCQPGTYGIAPKQAVCPDCPEGNYCPYLGGKNFTTCPAGHYCPRKSAAPTPCPNGTYALNEGLHNVSQCLNCAPGSYCSGTGLTDVSGACAAGYYCPGGQSTPTPDSYRCIPGHYCEAGSVDPTPCPQGTFSANYGNVADSDCLPCLTGKYCDRPGLTEESGNCTEGYYCTLGSDTPAPTDGVKGDVCPTGSYCAEGSGSPTPCSNGTYTDITTQAACFTCPKGYYCSVSSGTKNPTPCPTGHYCPANTGYPIPKCPPGSYAPNTGNENITQCLLCSGGKFCSKEGLTAPDGDCADGYSCLSGAVDAQGTPGILGGKSSYCPTGHYCPQGVASPVPCPIGTFNPNGNGTSLSDCQACSPGKYCPVVGLSAATLDCAKGYYCVTGAKIAKPKDGTTGDLCPKAKYCPTGTSVPVNCPNGTYSNVFGLDTCFACPAGFYCGEATINPADCPQGRYCPPSTGPDQPKCPPGSFNDQLKLKQQSECSLCDGGHFCSQYGLTSPDGDCTEGYYCTSGAMSANGTLGVLGGDSGFCPPGHYCLSGSAFPSPCPSGRYTPFNGSKSLSECLQCDPGKYCPFPGQSASTLECIEGFYCSGGANIRSPVDNVTGNACPTGYYCPAGSSAPVACAEGTYNDITAQSTCKICPAGYYCPNATTDPVVCPPGNYCPQGTGSTLPECPLGTFSNQSRREAASECTLCSGGSYCASTGLSVPTATCDAGYYCTRGAINSTGALGMLGGEAGICPKGSYCPQGSTLPIYCPKGTFRNIVGGTALASCSSCTPGMYCAEFGLYLPSGNCSAGFYCPAGQFQKEPPAYVCPEGHFCLEGSAEPTGCYGGTYQTGKGESFCLTCPPGYYCRNNSALPLECPLASFCPNGTENPFLCPNGTYGFMPGLHSEEDCASCPPGKYCQNGVVSGICEAGFICYTGSPVPNPPDAASATCDHCICPKGYYCPEGTKWPVPCSNGTFGAYEGGKNSSVCGACQPGDWCLDSSIRPVPCPTGQYCPNSNNIKYPLDCPKGTYNPVESGASLSDCLPCEPGFYCPTTGLTTYLSNPCPVGTYCVSGRSSPVNCPAGTYRDTQNGVDLSSCTQCPLSHYCPTRSDSPIECSVGKFCPAGTGSTQPQCPGGQYCPKRTPEPLECPAGYYCPEGTPSPIYCPLGYYCPTNSSAPILCPAGYRRYNRTGLRASVADSCIICEAGTYGNDTNREFCRPCAPGYVCLTGATRPNPTSVSEHKGYICPVAHKCPGGTAEEIPCEPGTYNPNTGFGEAQCTLCEVNTFSHLSGNSKCSRCGPSSESTTNRTTCACIGENRVYQYSDRSCICKSGYAFYSGNEDLSDEDSTYSCVPIVYDRCGREQVRSFTGQCVDTGSEACTAACGSAGGVINADTKGVCECNNLKPVQAVCDADCRASRLRLQVHESQFQLYDPVEGKVVLTFTSSSLVGTPTCLSTCTVEVEKMQSGGFLGVYKAGIEYYRSLFNNQTSSSSSGGSTSTRSLPFMYTATEDSSSAVVPNIHSDSNLNHLSMDVHKRKATADTITIDGIDQPVVCLQLGSGMVWDVSASKEDYPYYLKNSPINSNPDFDAGPFRSLAESMKSNATVSMFIYMFQEAGTFVFANVGNPDKITVIRVMEEGLTCPDDQTFKPLTADNLVGLSVAINNSQYLSPDFVLIIVLVVGFVVFLGLLLAGVHFFRTRTWSSQFGARPKFKKNTLASLDIFAKKQQFEEKLVNLEGFNVKLFLEKLNHNGERIDDYMADYKDDLDEKYSNILRETAQIRELLGMTTDDTASLFNVEESMKLLNEIDSPDKAERVLDELVVQIQALQQERDLKTLPDVTKLDGETAKRVLELDDLDDTNRAEVIKSYNLFISKLQDLKDSMDSLRGKHNPEARQDMDALVTKFNNTLGHGKKMISHRLQEMNDTISEKNELCKSGDNEFTLDPTSADRLREFLQTSLTDIFMKYNQERMAKEAGDVPAGAGTAVGTSSKKEDDETSELSELSDTETEPDTEEDESWTQEEVLESQLRKRHRQVKSVQRAQLDQLDEEIDEEFIKEKELIEQHFASESNDIMKNLKQELRNAIDNGTLSPEAQKSLIRDSKKRMDIVKTSMDREKESQTQMLTRLMEQKKARKLQQLENHQRNQRKLDKKQAAEERREFAEFMKKVDEQAAKITDEKSRELFRQKEILKHKLETARQQRAKTHALEKMHLKEHLGKMDKIDLDLEKQKHDRLSEMKIQNMQNLHQQQLSALSSDTPTEVRDKLVKQQQEQLNGYKQRLEDQKKEAEQALKERLKERSNTLTQQVENRRALAEQAEIKSEEKDLNKLRQLMESSLTDLSAIESSRSTARRRQEQDIQKRLHEMSMRRSEKNRLLEEQQEKERLKIESERESQASNFTKKFDADLKKKIAQKEEFLQQQLAHQDLSDSEKEKILMAHKLDVGEYSEKMEANRQKQLQEINRKMDDRLRKMRKAFDQRKVNDLKGDLEQQEKLLNRNIEQFKTVPKVHIELSRKSKDTIDQLKKQHEDELKSLQKNLEHQTELTLQSESKRDLKALEGDKKKRKEQEKAKASLQSQMQAELAANKESERERIMQKYDEELQKLNRHQQSQAKSQENALQQKLAERRAQLRRKQQEAMEKKRSELKQQEEETLVKQRTDAERKKILDLIMDDKRRVHTIEDAVNSVLFERQNKELVDLEMRQRSEYNQAKSKDEKQKLKTKHLEQRVELKKDHLGEKERFVADFAKYKALMQQGNDEQRKLEEELEKFHDSINKQKETNMARIERQKQALREQMQKELEEENRKAKEEAEKMKKRLEKARNELQVEELVKEAEEQQKDILEKQKNMEQDEKARLLEQHQLNLSAFEEALEAERIRQEQILRKRIDSYEAAEKKKKQEEALEKMNAQFTGKRVKKQNGPRIAQKTSSLINNISADKFTKGSKNFKKLKTAADIFPREHRWVTPIYQRIKNIESQVLGEKRTFIDATEPQENEGELSIIQEKSLSLTQLIVCRFGQFILHSLQDKYRSMKRIQLLVAYKLPHTNYVRNSFKNSFYWDDASNTLFIRHTRLATVGKFVLTLLHCLAHIHAGNLIDDTHPDFLKYFYAFMSAVSEEVFATRQQSKYQPSSDDKTHREQVVQEIVNTQLSTNDPDAFLAQLNKKNPQRGAPKTESASDFQKQQLIRLRLEKKQASDMIRQHAQNVRSLQSQVNEKKSTGANAAEISLLENQIRTEQQKSQTQTMLLSKLSGDIRTLEARIK